MIDQAHHTALSIAQMLISAQAKDGSVVTREVIEEKARLAISTVPQLSEDDFRWLIAELEERFHIWIGNVQVLGDNTDHIAWLPTRKSEIDWGYWSRYRDYVSRDMAPAAVDSLDEITDDILSRLEDPHREGAWSRRGLVVGHVQSGKTANYIGLINKAADAGYKVIVVLAGMHRNLRAQTQIRLDEGFLGYVSSPPQPGQSAMQPVGVGELNPSLRPQSITNRRDSGDFTRTVANQFNIGPDTKPLLFVVKKNASVLKNLAEWVEWVATSVDPETGRRVVRKVPLLLIDDEADQASVDTNELEFDSDTGLPNEDHDPAKINALVRRLLHCFERNAYIGYTATPFANIYIHEHAATAEHGEDLFPRSFIVNVPAPSNYFGPSRLFGPDTDEADADSDPARSVIRVIDDFVDDGTTPAVGWMPPRHKNGHLPRYKGADRLPPTLVTAVKVFLLATAARRCRGHISAHHSMLIHVTRFVSVQREVRRQVERTVADLQVRWRNEDADDPNGLVSELENLWAEEMEPRLTEQIDWRRIATEMPAVLRSVAVMEINGTSADILAYEEHKESGLTVIAVGGDKLSRGLTLSGLSVSYFLRAASMYDTLMQMGRWFGYRAGYEDLCRIYMTAELLDWFRHITKAAEELRQQFDHMVAVRATPRDYGLKVQSHPVLLVTSRVKSRNAIRLKLSYAGDVSETVALHAASDQVQKNHAAVMELLSLAGSPELDPSRTRPEGKVRTWTGTRLWEKVPARHVVAFLRQFDFHPDAYKADGKLLARYIETLYPSGELVEWTIALLRGEGRSLNVGPYEVSTVTREPIVEPPSNHYRIRRLLSPDDESIDLDAVQYSAALDETRLVFQADPGRSRRKEPPNVPSGPMLRRQRPSSRGLVLLYPLDPMPLNVHGVDKECPIVGVGVSFPGSGRTEKVEYTVNAIYYEQEVGGP